MSGGCPISETRIWSASNDDALMMGNVIPETRSKNQSNSGSTEYRPQNSKTFRGRVLKAYDCEMVISLIRW